MVKDTQIQRLYDWERKYIRNTHTKLINLKEARRLVKIVWADYGFYVEPTVAILPEPYNDTLAQANRWIIEIQPEIPLWVIYHEMAHSIILTTGANDGHGKHFLGIYFGLLEVYLKENIQNLMITAKEFDLEYDYEIPPPQYIYC